MKTAGFVLMGLVLLVSPVHVLPALPTLVLLALWGAVTLQEPRRLPAPALVLAANYGYWAAHLLFGSLPWTALASYGFLRWQSRLFLAFLPFFTTATPHLTPPTERIRRLVYAFLFAATAAAVAGVVQLAAGLHVQAGLSVLGYLELAGLPVADLHGEQWFLGFHRSHTAAGAFYLLPALLSLSLFLFSGRSRVQAVGLGLFTITVWALAFTKARSAYAGFLVALIAALTLYLGASMRRPTSVTSRVLVTLAILAVVACMLLAVPGAAARAGIGSPAASRVAPEDGPQPALQRIAEKTVSDRFVYWAAALRMFRDEPVFGVGLGQFPALFSSRFGGLLALPYPHPEAYHAHNSYLHMLAELGLVGFLLFLGFWLATLRALVAALRVGPGEGFERAFVLGVILCVLAEAVVAAFDYNLASPSGMVPLSLLMGLALRLRSGSDEGQS